MARNPEAITKIVKFEGQEYECRRGVEIHGRAIRIEFTWQGLVHKARFCSIDKGADIQRLLNDASYVYGTIRRMLDVNRFNSDLYAQLLPESEFAKRFGLGDPNITFGECAQKYILSLEFLVATAQMSHTTAKNKADILVGGWNDREDFEIIKKKTLTYVGKIANCDDRQLRDVGLFHLPIYMIQFSTIKALQDHLVRRRLGPSAINNVMSAIRTTFDYAIENLRVIKENPAETIRTLKRPTKKAEDHVFFTPEQQDKVYQSILNDKKPWLAELFLFGCWTGLRKEELLGLAWEDYDPERRLLEVRRANTESAFKEVKANGNRALVIPKIAAECLERMRSFTENLEPRIYSVARKEALGTVDEERRLIFMNFGRSKRHPVAWNETSIRNAWGRVKERSGIDVAVMFVRHSFATLAVVAGVPENVICKDIGLSTPAMLRKSYGDVRHVVDPVAADRRDEMLEEALERGFEVFK